MNDHAAAPKHPKNVTLQNDAHSLAPEDWDEHIKKVSEQAKKTDDSAAKPRSKPGIVPAHIVCVIDRSGSMETIREDAIGGFNAFLKEQQALPGEATITLALFDHEYDLVYDEAPLAAARPLDVHTYQPRGSTALHDAIGRTIEHVSRHEARSMLETKMIACILTDGYENASQRYSAKDVRRLIEAKRSAGWEFVFLAANQDAVTTAREMAIPAESAASFAPTSAGTARAFVGMSERVVAHRVSFANEEDAS